MDLSLAFKVNIRKSAHRNPETTELFKKFSERGEQTLKQEYFQLTLEVQCAFKDLMIHGFCNSHYVSHFAAFFIVART